MKTLVMFAHRLCRSHAKRLCSRRIQLAVVHSCLALVLGSVSPARAQSDAASWDKLFKQKDYVFGTDPVPLLTDNIEVLRKGKALVLAMGEGRNAVYLAEQGFDVTGVDISEVAVEKSRRLAAQRGVQMETAVADLRNYAIEPETYDLITNIYFPQRYLFDQIKKGLKPGGIFVYEQWHPFRWNRPHAESEPGRRKTSGVEVFQYSDMSLEELAKNFRDFRIILYREAVIDQAFSMGGHSGVVLTEVTSLIAQKPF